MFQEMFLLQQQQILTLKTAVLEVCFMDLAQPI